MSGLCMQNTPSFDLIAYDDAMRHAGKKIFTD